MSSIRTLGAIVAWFMKVLLLFVGLVFLFSSGYALYYRGIGLVLLFVSALTFRTTQARLLRERGIRIPTAAVAVLLIGSFVVFGAVAPMADDLDVSGMSAETTGEALTFGMSVTNTADGPVTNTNVTVRVNASGQTLGETTLVDERFESGETRTFDVEVVSMDDLPAAEQARIREGDYRVIVVFDGDTEGAVYTPT